MFGEPLSVLDPGSTYERPIHAFAFQGIVDFVIIFFVVVADAIVFIVIFIFHVIILLRIEQDRSILRPLVRANDELAQELVTQTVKVVAVEFRVGAVPEICFC